MAEEPKPAKPLWSDDLGSDNDWVPGRGLPLERLYAWVAQEADGGEGICSAEIPGFGALPLVGGDRHRMASLRPHAVKVRALTGCPVRLVVFATRRIIEDLP